MGCGSSTPKDPFLKAVEAGKIDEMKALAQTVPNINVQAPVETIIHAPRDKRIKGGHALHIAARQGNVAMLEALLQLPGIDVNPTMKYFSPNTGMLMEVTPIQAAMTGMPGFGVLRVESFKTLLQCKEVDLATTKNPQAFREQQKGENDFAYKKAKAVATFVGSNGETRLPMILFLAQQSDCRNAMGQNPEIPEIHKTAAFMMEALLTDPRTSVDEVIGRACLPFIGHNPETAAALMRDPRTGVTQSNVDEIVARGPRPDDFFGFM